MDIKRISNGYHLGSKCQNGINACTKRVPNVYQTGIKRVSNGYQRVSGANLFKGYQNIFLFAKKLWFPRSWPHTATPASQGTTPSSAASRVAGGLCCALCSRGSRRVRARGSIRLVGVAPPTRFSGNALFIFILLKIELQSSKTEKQKLMEIED